MCVLTGPTVLQKNQDQALKQLYHFYTFKLVTTRKIKHKGGCILLMGIQSGASDVTYAVTYVTYAVTSSWSLLDSYEATVIKHTDC